MFERFFMSSSQIRNNLLHKLLFKPNGLVDDENLAYCVNKQKLLEGYKKGDGIVCNCCHREISPSQFEAHAGMSARRQPYRHICTSNGLTLHDIAIALENRQKLTMSDNMCAIRGLDVNRVVCDKCSCVFHAVCLRLESETKGDNHCSKCLELVCDRKTGTGDSIAIPNKDCLTQVVKPSGSVTVVKPSGSVTVGCIICQAIDFSSDEFDDRTIMFCDQCEKEFHVGCLRDMGLCDLKELPKGKWFCSVNCEKIHAILQKSVLDGAYMIPAALSSTISRKQAEKGILVDEAEITCQVLRGKNCPSEHYPLLSSAAAIFSDCFGAIVSKTGSDLISVMVFGEKLVDKSIDVDEDYSGMYCAVLSVKSVVVSAALLRIFGGVIAEVPLAATSEGHQGKGYFQALFSCIERLLYSMNVEKVVLPATKKAMSIWTKKFGFKSMTKKQVLDYDWNFPLALFSDATMLEKKVKKFKDRKQAS